MGLRVNTAVWLEQYQRWQIKVRKDGVRRTFTCPIPGYKGQRECQKKADEWLDEGIISGNTKVTKLFGKWIEELKISTSKSHWLQYERYGTNYILPKIGCKKIGSLSCQDLQDVLIYAHKNGNDKSGLAAKTLQNIRACLVAFMKYARKNQSSKLYPEGLYIPSTAKKSHKDTMQPKDLKTLFSAFQTLKYGKPIDEWYIFAFRFAVVTGLRPGELLALQNSNINLRTRVCNVKGSVNVYGEHTEGKNKNAIRSFVLPQIAVDILKEQRAMLKKTGMISNYVFPGLDGQCSKQSIYSKHWIRYRDANGMGKLSPYELRHTFFSINKSLPVEMVKIIGGHSDSFDTFGTYGHQLNSDAKNAAQLVDKEINKVLKPKRG